MATIELKVRGDSNPSSVAGALTKYYEAGETVELVAVGAAAVNQSVKALAIARGWIASHGKDLLVRPGFHTIEIDGQERTAIKFFVVAG
jgi:stage V sporulation protein S